MQLRRSLIATGMVAALAVAGVTAAVANDPPPRIAFLANGIVPADALAAGPIAGQLGAPVYTTAPDHLVEGTGVALDAYDPDLVIVMGGPAALSDAVLAQVADVTGLSVEDSSPPPTSGIVRAAGQDRFETAAVAAALLGSYDPAFLPTDMQAADSDLLDGKDSSAFQPAGDYLGRTQQAADSDMLDGRDSTAFLGKTEQATDSDTLDGLDSTAFLPSNGEIAIADRSVFAGSGSSLTLARYSNTTEVYGSGNFVTSYPSIPTVLIGQKVAVVGFEVCYSTLGTSEITFLELDVDQATSNGSSTDIATSMDGTVRTDDNCIRSDLATPQLLDSSTSVSAYIGVNAPDSSNRVELSHITYYFEANPENAAAVSSAARMTSDDGTDATVSSR